MDTPATYTVTRAKDGGLKDNPAVPGKQLRKWYVGLTSPAESFDDVYWQRQPDNEVKIGDEVYGTITQGDYGPRFKMEKPKANGGAPAAHRGADNLPPEFWEAKDRRIARAGMLQAVVQAVPFDAADPGQWVEDCNSYTDFLIASLDERTPSPNQPDTGRGGERPSSLAAGGPPAASAAAPPAAHSNGHGFASEPQEKYFRKLLADAGGSPDTVSAICAYAAASLDGSRSGGISIAIDGLKEEETRRETAKRLADEANRWAQEQTDLPAPDTTGLDPVAVVGDAEDDIPF